MQHIIQKDLPTWLKVATTLEKPPTPSHWQHQAITWTNIDWSLVKSSDSHIRAISKEMLQPSITKIGLKITYIKFHSNFPGANELTHWGRDKMAAISQTMFSNAFSWMEIYEFQ